MFQSLLSVILLMFAIFAVDHLGITSADMTEDETKTEASKHTEPIISSTKFTDRIAARGRS